MSEEINLDELTEKIIAKLREPSAQLNGPILSEEQKKRDCISYLCGLLTQGYYGDHNEYVNNWRSKVVQIVKSGILELA